ncbi:hypothetical protein M8C21_018973 [Ambrosia artemisiifolia]|uniref:DNA topoisomerase (ATP-hydrolyzing) n=1 Tax=Ambrosia artemisiifolia TaxID=4212 RepID=A0AAD5C5S9_AMBAR|nr:hypothetical protein M8C21_018973 [Ambrosia artemisiifolia]
MNHLSSYTPNTTSSSMSFTAGFRFFRCYTQLSLPIPAARFPRQACYTFNNLRFLSSTSRSRRLTSANSKRRESAASEGLDDGGNEGLTAVVNGGDGEGRIVATELHKEATEAYMSYAMSVLLGRALPDVRDGLKPVHRRILYALHELGLSSRKPHKKCARVVGEVLGKFHPHGDNAVYDSLVRMAQDFSLRCPLVSGHGNFGSVDGDNPAAMRYTECRLEALAETMLLSDLDMDTVDFVPNFDNSLKEPSLLPARIPNLLLNGSSGIAVGMATNIPPHNLGELVDALSILIHNPDATLQELLEYMPGPDFPTGGIIMGNLGILDAYRTGKGRVIVRGKTEIETSDSKSKSAAIVVKEIPYQTNKSSLVMKIAELIQNKTLEGISDIRDESDRSGMRIVIELKRGSDPAIVLNNLYRFTALQSSFSCNMVGILDGHPKQMGLKELLQAFLDFRCSVVERRARFKLAHARDRNHIVEGILLGLDNIDAVIDVIRKASSNSAASADLRKKFKLSEKQAEAILDINLRRLTLLEILSLSDGERITSIIPVSEFAEDQYLLMLTANGYIKKVSLMYFSSIRSSGIIALQLVPGDSLKWVRRCTNEDYVAMASQNGFVILSSCEIIRALGRNTRGSVAMRLKEGDRMACVDIIPAAKQDGIEHVPEPDHKHKHPHGPWLLFVSENGYGKRVPLSRFRQSPLNRVGLIGYKFSSEDHLAAVFVVGFTTAEDGESDEQVVLVSQSGTVNRIKVRDIPIQSRYARGVILMRLEHAGKIQSASLISASETEIEEVEAAAV